MADESALSPAEENDMPNGGEIPSAPVAPDELAALQARVTELEQGVNQYKDQLLRKAAEFENYKRRTESDYASMIRYSTEEMITKLLPVLDDFERFMKTGAAGSGSDEGSFFRGAELIFAKFKKLLDTHGVTEMEVIGKPFNPELHDPLREEASTHQIQVRTHGNIIMLRQIYKIK